MSQSAFRSYPRSVPYQPPQEPTGREAWLRGWMLLLIGSTALIVFVLIAGSIWALTRPSPRRAEASRPAAPASRTWVRDLTPAVVDELPSQLPLPPAGVQPSEPPPETGKPPEPMRSAEPLLEALGGLTAAHLYQSYLNIGLLADSAESEVYSTAEAKKLLETLTSLLNTVDRQLAKVGEQELKSADRKSLERTQQLVVLLRTQAAELKAYWDTGEKEHTLKFHKAREEAWAGIRDLLGLPE